VAKLRIIFDITKELSGKMRKSGYSASVTDSPDPGVSQITPSIVYALVRFSLKPVLIYSISHLSVSFFKRTDLKPIACVTRGWLFVLRQKSKKTAKNETPHLIQLIEKIRIFAQNLLKIALSRARFTMLGCYINKNIIQAVL
jgi:hypothetical protein